MVAWRLGLTIRLRAPRASPRVVSAARMENEARHILATVSEGSAPRIEMVNMRDQNLQVADE